LLKVNILSPEIEVDEQAERLAKLPEYQLAYDLWRESKERWKKSFFHFFLQAWTVLEPETKFKNNWHIGLIAEYLHAVRDGQIQKLVINIPPRYLKSMQITIAFPTWVWTTDPYHRFIMSSYSDKLSLNLALKRRQVLESEWYRATFSARTKLMKDQNQKGFYQNIVKGFMFSTSTGGTVTGEGCNTMIIDDPQKPTEALSDVAREKSIEFWKGTLSTRFNDPKSKKVILVMQRLHEQDLTGYFKENEDCTELVIPNEAFQKITYHYPKSGRIKIYEEGELLHPDREGRQELDQAKKTLGSFNYAAQKLQSPVPLEGGLVKTKWLKYYTRLPDYFDRVTISIDCTFKGLETSDYVAMHAYGKRGADEYLLKRKKGQWGIVDTLKELAAFILQFPGYREILIEDKANGTAVIELFKNKFARIIPISPKDSKLSRLNAVSPTIEAGNYWLPSPDLDPSINDFVVEMTTFPRGKHDDEVDAMTQYLNRVRDNEVGAFSTGDAEEIVEDTIVGSLSQNAW
jgi:predicted phage terminase large subunit-like protein